MASELKRKLFHLTGFVYILIGYVLPRSVYLVGLLACVVVMGGFEWARLHWPVFGEGVMRWAGGLYREKEKTTFSGVFWMACGVWVARWVLEPLPMFAACVSYLLLGDAVASLLGRAHPQSPRVFGTTKSWVGSAGCFLVCMVVGVVVILPTFGWWPVLLGALGATVAEALPVSLDDNLLVPVASALVLRFFV